MPDYARIVAITAAPDVMPLPGLPSAKPIAKGQTGYMELAAARAAETAGSVMVMVDNSPLDIETEIGGEILGPFPVVARPFPAPVQPQPPVQQPPAPQTGP